MKALARIRLSRLCGYAVQDVKWNSALLCCAWRRSASLRCARLSLATLGSELRIAVLRHATPCWASLGSARLRYASNSALPRYAPLGPALLRCAVLCLEPALG